MRITRITLISRNDCFSVIRRIREIGFAELKVGISPAGNALSFPWSLGTHANWNQLAFSAQWQLVVFKLVFYQKNSLVSVIFWKKNDVFFLIIKKRYIFALKINHLALFFVEFRWNRIMEKRAKYVPELCVSGIRRGGMYCCANDITLPYNRNWLLPEKWRSVVIPELYEELRLFWPLNVWIFCFYSLYSFF